MRACPYCNGPMRHPTRDHINPKSRGGGPSIVVCARCNVFKTNRSVLAWLMWLEAHRPSRLPTVCRLYTASGVMQRVSDADRPQLTAFMGRYMT